MTLIKYISLNTRDDTYLNKEGEYVAIPRDENGLYSIEFLRGCGVDITHSEIRAEKHRYVEGNGTYLQKMRADTFTNNQFSPRICIFYGETRGNTGILTIKD